MRVSDITMGDFWGLEKSQPDKFDPNGVSMLLINSSKGEKLLESIKAKVKLFNGELSDADQPQLHNPCIIPEKYDDFWNSYQKGFKYIAIKYFHAGKIRRFISRVLRAVIE